MISIANVHNQVKLKFNKVDSQQNINFRVPQLDMFINDAILWFVKGITQPRLVPNNIGTGFEFSQRNTDDIRTLVKNNIELTLTDDNDIWTAALPDDYMFHVSSNVTINKNDCNKRIRTTVIEHDDKGTDLLSSSSFEWETVNIKFYDKGIRVFTNEFTPILFQLDYIKKPVYVHYAQGYGAGTYNRPDGSVLTGVQDIDLPEHVEQDIVNITRDLMLLSIGNAPMKPNIA